MGERAEKKGARLQEIFQPPDGGWGWMIVCGTAISQMFLIPLLQNFTLIFKDRFSELGFTATEITTLVSLNASFGMILGLLNGPLLKIFGYRKMALFGLTVYLIGILCTGIAKSYIEFIIFYGVLSSLGMAKVMASFSLAMNSYFQKNRSKAVGYTVTLTGLGPIAMPYLISHLLSSYGLKWTVFLLAGLNLHAYIGALLLQPVKWHAKSQSHLHPDEESKILLSDVHSFLEMSVWGSSMSLPTHPADLPIKSRKSHSKEIRQPDFRKEQTKDERRRPRKLSVTFLDNEDYKNMMNSTLHMIERLDVHGKNIRYASVETLSLENGEGTGDTEKNPTDPLNSDLEATECDAVKLEVSVPQQSGTRGCFSRSSRFLGDIYDLDLLQDRCYVNILLGLSLAFAGEVVFSTMTPIILKEVGFGTEDTATFLSVIAGADLLCRFIAPFVGKRLNLNSKKMYLFALLMLLACRAGMYLANSYQVCIVVSLGLGVGKGFRSVFWILVLPDYVPLSKLASASAFQSLINGILILASGPLIGSVTALTNSYLSIIAASNVLTLTTILLWSGEIIYLKYKKKGDRESFPPTSSAAS